MYLVIEFNKIMIGHLLNMKIVVKNMNKWQKMIEKRKNRKSYGVNFFLLKIKILLKIKKLLLKCSKKYIQLENKRKLFQ